MRLISPEITRASVAHLAASLVLGVLAFAGGAKLADLPGFYGSLQTWTMLPGWSRPFVAVLVPLAESTLAVAWFSGRAPVLALRGALGLLALFVAAWIMQLMTAHMPECQCLGKLLRFRDGQQAAWSHLAVNGALLGLLTLAAWFLHDPKAFSAPPAAQPRRPSPVASRAFTLLETIIATLFVAVLVAMLLPSLAPARDAARTAKALAHLRSHAATMASYTADWQDRYPLYTDPEASVVLRAPGLTVTVHDYFAGFSLWHVALADRYFDGAWDTDAFREPGTDDRVYTSYWYAATFLADPKFWNPETRTGPQQWRGIRDGEVAFPAQKTILIGGSRGGDLRGPYGIIRRDTGRTLFAFVDGHAADFATATLKRGYIGGEGTYRGSWFHADMPGMHTIDGVRGRDVP